jgi:hypothetical protein
VNDYCGSEAASRRQKRGGEEVALHDAEVFMAHVRRSSTELVAIVMLTGACSRSEEARPAGAETGVTDSAALAASESGSGKLRISNVMIGRQVGRGNLITQPTFEFAPQDTIHVSVATEGSGRASRVTAAWRSQSGKILQQTSEPVRHAGENMEFRLSQPNGLKTGTYKVIVFLDDDSVETKVFVVRK